MLANKSLSSTTLMVLQIPTSINPFLNALVVRIAKIYLGSHIPINLFRKYYQMVLTQMA